MLAYFPRLPASCATCNQAAGREDQTGKTSTDDGAWDGSGDLCNDFLTELVRVKWAIERIYQVSDVVCCRPARRTQHIPAQKNEKTGPGK